MENGLLSHEVVVHIAVLGNSFAFLIHRELDHVLHRGKNRLCVLQARGHSIRCRLSSEQSHEVS
jgi:hypothetical protein